jgi:hypothetical protein
MEDRVGKVVPEGGERAMHMAGLPAAMAVRPDQLRPAIEAGAALAMPFAGVRLDRPGGQPARHRFADAFEAPGHHRASMAKAKARVETLRNQTSAVAEA